MCREVNPHVIVAEMQRNAGLPDVRNRILGGYCGGVPPLPIPNREVKPTSADGTAMQCGRVGNRLLYLRVLRRKSRDSLFLVSSKKLFKNPSPTLAPPLSNSPKSPWFSETLFYLFPLPPSGRETLGNGFLRCIFFLVSPLSYSVIKKAVANCTAFLWFTLLFLVTVKK